MQILIGFLLGTLVGIASWYAGALSVSGAWAAALSGGLIFGFGGLPWAVLLMAFFISSSALSRVSKGRKAALSEKFSKGSRRDWGQVFANGGLGAALAVVFGLAPSAIWPWAAFAGAMAAVTADTWATELGVLSQAPPRLITSGKIVERGASGGISFTGSLASLAGAFLIALFTIVFTTGIPLNDRSVLFLAVVLGGIAGSFFDSLLGATVQAIYTCPACNKETERHPQHTCGTNTLHLRGWRWLNNDLVNFFASIVGALISLGLVVLLLAG